MSEILTSAPERGDDNKTYLGDGVYARHDGYMIELTVENGISAGPPIFLEPSVFDALVRWRDRECRAAHLAGRPVLPCARAEQETDK